MEQAVIVHIPLDDDQFGSSGRRSQLSKLEDALIEAVELAETGEFDGNDFGQGECTFFIYGPDADEIFMVIEVVLKEFPVARGGYAIKRYGEVDDDNAKELRVTWSSDEQMPRRTGAGVKRSWIQRLFGRGPGR